MSAAVSIIVPCYNVAPYLDKCMESLTLQTLGDLEIISVNDGSGDDTPAILRAWAERDGRIRVVDRENGGLSAARNTGMALAGGEYIGFVDPDDYVEHSMYGRLLERPAERPGLLSRILWKRLSLRKGRRGRYYALRLLLASCGGKTHS